MAEKLTCPSCGAKYKAGRKRCKVCGYLLTDDEIDRIQDIGDNDEDNDEIDKEYIDISDSEEFYKLKEEKLKKELGKKPFVILIVKILLSLGTAFMGYNVLKVSLLQLYRIILNYL